MVVDPDARWRLTHPDGMGLIYMSGKHVFKPLLALWTVGADATSGWITRGRSTQAADLRYRVVGRRQPPHQGVVTGPTRSAGMPADQQWGLGIPYGVEP